MKYTNSGPDIVDTRIVFRVYAGLMALAGLLLLAHRAIGLTTTVLPPGPGRTAFGLLAATACFVASCIAIGLSQVEQPRSRHHALLWFAVAHAVLLAGTVAVAVVIGGRGGSLDPGDVGLEYLVAVTMLLFYFWQTGDGHRAGETQRTTMLFRTDTEAVERLRSAYDEQIRAAASQEERQHLARDLHDSIKQQIFAMQTAAATAQARFDGDAAGAKEALDRVREAGREAMAEMEAMLDNLRAAPVENLGLVEALKRQVESLGFRTGARVSFEVGSLPPSEAFEPNAQMAVFRVAQEALSNVARHARASAVKVSLHADAWRLILRIDDNGSGFDLNAPGTGMGLANMRERAEAFGGGLQIQSRPGDGTSVTLSMPFATWAGGGLVEYKTRLRIWATVVTANALIVAIELGRGSSSSGTPLLGVLIANVIILARVAHGYFVARRQAEASPWIESPSHS